MKNKNTKVENINYLCQKCNIGIVKVIKKDTNEYISIDVKSCTNCKYKYGIKSIMTLKQIKDENINVKYTFNSNFKLSTNYKLLWDLIFKGYRIPAWIVYTDKYEEPIWDLVEVKKTPYGEENNYSIGSRGIGYEGAKNYEAFNDICLMYSLHFIEPDKL